MKTINFLTSHFIPENTACTNRVLAYIQALEHQYKINVITLSEKGIDEKKLQVRYSKNVNIFYVNQKDFDGKNFYKRAINEIKYINELINLSNSLSSDIVIATSPYMFMIPLVAFRVKKSKVLDIRDLVWEYLDSKKTVNKIIKNVLTFLMIKSIHKFDYVTVTNDFEKKILFQKYGLNKVDIISNGIDQERYDKLIKIESGMQSKCTVTYVGNIGLAQNLKVLIDAAMQLKDIIFLIIGDGIEADELRHYVEKNSVDNVVFTGKLKWDELAFYYNKSSLLYAQLDEKYVSAVPSKLYEYASIGLPIIYGGVGSAKLLIDSLENSIIIPPNNSEELVYAIKRMKEKENKISYKNRELVKTKYLRKNAAKNINKILESL